MKQKIRQIMVIQRCLCDNKIKKPSPPMEVVQAEVQRIRDRLSIIKKRNDHIQKEKKLMIQKAGCSYGFGDKKLSFPFFTMANDYYAQFMTNIMKNLQGRFYNKGLVIAEEQEECLEVIFVLRGKYNIGYEINRKRRFRKQFGPSTLIGAFQMCFLKRHQFLIVA